MFCYPFCQSRPRSKMLGRAELSYVNWESNTGEKLMARLRVGVIGCGTVAQIMWLPNLRELDDHFDLKAICDISPGLVESLGSYYNVSSCFVDYRDLIAANLDVVIILTPGSHAAAAIAAMQAGKHVLVEKPMCFTL